MYSEDDLIPISALQHVMFCQRQYALIHLEQEWEEKHYTMEGTLLHERVDAERHESRRFFRQEYGMPVRSLKWGLIGKCDLVEIWFQNDGKTARVSPVEFKRGKEKENDADRVQLCAQALCLEEMFGVGVPDGQFYYFKNHRRTSSQIDESIREKTRGLTETIRKISGSKKTPPANYESKKCDRCSLIDVCMPRYISTNKTVDFFVEKQLKQMRKICNVDADTEIQNNKIEIISGENNEETT
jgi:CRISPR-associated exonuclease Cas4